MWQTRMESVWGPSTMVGEPVNVSKRGWTVQHLLILCPPLILQYNAEEEKSIDVHVTVALGALSVGPTLESA